MTTGFARSWLLLAVTSSVAGCIANGAKPYDSAADRIRGDRAIVVVGVTVAWPWQYERFGVTLDQYDLASQVITGGCFSYTRLEARIDVPAERVPTRYFAFEAPAGYYAYSAFNAARLAGESQAFEAPPAHAVYIGNFVLESEGVTLRRELGAQERAGIAQAVPELPAPLELSAAVPAAPARFFMCTP